ncbi:hypothetical protein TSUD_204640 [Trifolium subterraneum]|uniref:Uncharacterized protein n=1 Tax=Trifolium subterraneum TaxID=3900 RepID=A0A2Z6MZU0_TRISU|nr:hypothetical protein TSUD_204640 [Trifolium subterraneum]
MCADLMTTRVTSCNCVEWTVEICVSGSTVQYNAVEIRLFPTVSGGSDGFGGGGKTIARRGSVVVSGQVSGGLGSGKRKSEFLTGGSGLGEVVPGGVASGGFGQSGRLCDCSICFSDISIAHSKSE